MRVLTRAESDDLFAAHLAWVEVMIDTGVIQFATHPLERMFGYGLSGELEGLTIEALLPSGVREVHAKTHRTHFADDPTPRMMGRSAKLQGQRKDGSVFPVEVMLLPKAVNRVRVVVALVFDMSERV